MMDAAALCTRHFSKRFAIGKSMIEKITANNKGTIKDCRMYMMATTAKITIRFAAVFTLLDTIKIRFMDEMNRM